MGLIEIWCNCANCSDEFMLNSDQRFRQRLHPNTKFFCCHSCHMEYREDQKRMRRTPWEWLKVTKVLDCLPTEEPPEIWVGY